MPIHDWTRVDAGLYHDFHQSWTVAIRNALNAGLLPDDYFAMVEQKTGGPEPDVVTLQLTPPAGLPPGGVAVAVQPPRVRHVTRAEAVWYAGKANRDADHHVRQAVHPQLDAGEADQQPGRQAGQQTDG